MCTLYGEWDNNLEEIVDDFYTKGHLKRKWESITTPEARELAKNDYEYSKKFFKNLADKLII